MVTGTDLPYKAVSINERGLEWKDPLWTAIVQWRHAQAINDVDLIEQACVSVEAAVEAAMRIAIEEADK